MSSYTVEMKPAARKELLSLPNDILARTVGRIEALAQDPRPPGCKKLKVYRNQWRIRVGAWRVIYTIDDAMRLISITRIAHRKDVYEH